MGILRLILALAVLLDHSKSPYHMTGGPTAVQIFFMISGFYMSLILDRKYTGPNRYSLFLSNRFLRIFPVYWIVFLITLSISLLSGFRHGQWGTLSYYLDYAHAMTAATLAFLIFTNLFLFGQELTCFLGINPESGKMFFASNVRATEPPLHHFIFVGQAWSLGIELLFYTIAPFMVQRKKSVIFLLLLLSLVVRGRLYGILKWPDEPWTYRFFPAEITLFLLGNISYRIYRTLEKKNPPRLICLLITIVTLAGCLFFQSIPAGYFFKWLFYAGICLALPFIFQLTKNSKIDAHIAEYSYPLYLVHLLALRVSKKLVTYWHFEDYQFLGMINSSALVNILFSLALSFLLIQFISAPIEKLRQSRLQRIPHPVALPPHS